MGRYLISAVFGGIVTLALAFLMQALIFPDTVLTADAAPVPTVDIFRDVIEEPPVDPPHVRPPAEQPPQPPVITKRIPNGGDGDPFALPEPAGYEPPTVGTGISRILTPSVRVPPEYPYRELTRGREGFVIVGFAVNEHGLTENVRVIRSEPPNAFDNAAIRAVQQWRYQPETDQDGNPITVGGQQARLTFEIENDQ